MQQYLLHRAILPLGELEIFLKMDCSTRKFFYIYNVMLTICPKFGFQPNFQ